MIICTLEVLFAKLIKIDILKNIKVHCERMIPNLSLLLLKFYFIRKKNNKTSIPFTKDH